MVYTKSTTCRLEMDISDTRNEIAKSVRMKHRHTCGSIWNAKLQDVGRKWNLLLKQWNIQSDHWLWGAETKRLGLEDKSPALCGPRFSSV